MSPRGVPTTPPPAPRPPRAVAPDSAVLLGQDMADFAAYLSRVSERQHVSAMAAVFLFDGFVDRARGLGRYQPPPTSPREDRTE